MVAVDGVCGIVVTLLLGVPKALMAIVAGYVSFRIRHVDDLFNGKIC